jgi:hypothetical protein
MVLFCFVGGDGRNRTDDRGFADPRLNHLATSPQKNGAEDEIRTRDPLLGKEVLYH